MLKVTYLLTYLLNTVITSAREVIFQFAFVLICLFVSRITQNLLL